MEGKQRQEGSYPRSPAQPGMQTLGPNPVHPGLFFPVKFTLILGPAPGHAMFHICFKLIIREMAA